MNDLHRVAQAGLDHLYLENGYKLRTTAYGPGYSYKNERGMLKAAAIQRAMQGGPLKGSELRFLRLELRLSQAELGERLAITDQTIAKWEKSPTPVKAKDALAIRILVLRELAPETCVADFSEEAPADPRIILRFGMEGWESVATSRSHKLRPLDHFAESVLVCMNVAVQHFGKDSRAMMHNRKQGTEAQIRYQATSGESSLVAAACC